MKRAKQGIRHALLGTVGEEQTDRIQGIYRSTKVPFAIAANVLVPDLRRSRQALRAMHNRYQGKRCVVIGNGPSLNKMDLTPLKDEYTFGLNRIYLAFERFGFSTTFLVVVNRLVIEQTGAELAATPSLKFINWAAQSYMPRTPDTIFFQSDKVRGFSTRPDLVGFRTSATVTCVALQLAYFLGFTEVVLIGVDHHFSTTGPAHREVTSSGADPNHFDPDYFGKGFRWQLPDLAQSEKGYLEMRRLFERAGRSIVDATVDGRLQVFPKADYRSLFNAEAGDLTRGNTGHER